MIIKQASQLGGASLSADSLGKTHKIKKDVQKEDLPGLKPRACAHLSRFVSTLLLFLPQLNVSGHGAPGHPHVDPLLIPPSRRWTRGLG